MNSKSNWSNAEMQNLIRVVNRLQDAFAQTGTAFEIDLPQIAVVGEQSAGKSSVLENFAGKDFLPRGSGLVTRRPIILQLINSEEEYGEFLHLPGNKFINFDEIRKEIDAETKRSLGHNKAISADPINLKIYSPHVLNLTLIDLPGLTKVPVDGQPSNIEQLIKDMIISFIEKKSCLILAVTPAAQDPENSAAIQLAREVDPEGLRTIGVLTKMDVMVAGTDARDVLENKRLYLKRGWVGVVNRSQQDIKNKTSIEEARVYEKQFFFDHPAYQDMADKLGTNYLQQVLNQQLTNHIRDNLPALRTKFMTELQSSEKEVESINTSLNERQSVMGMIRQITDHFEQDVLAKDCYEVKTETLSSGAEISDLFYIEAPLQLARILLDDQSLRKEIEISIKNAHGPRRELFTPNLAFDTIVRKQIQRLGEPFYQALYWVSGKLTVVAVESCQCMSGFPRLHDKALNMLKECIKKRELNTKQQITAFIEAERDSFNILHDDFMQNASLGVSRGDSIGDDVSISSTSKSRSNNGIIWRARLIIQDERTRGWFVLSSDSLKGYTDNSETIKIMDLNLDGIKIAGPEKNSFTIFHPNGKTLFKKPVQDPQTGKNFYQELNQVKFSCETQEEADTWIEMFSKRGNRSESTPFKRIASVPHMDRNPSQEVEAIKRAAESYIQIISKKVKDQIPKTITSSLIKEMEIFIKNDLTEGLLHALHTQGDTLMEQGPEETARRQKVLRTYMSLKEALKIIAEVDESTMSYESLKNEI